MMMLFCEHCGAGNASDTSYCFACHELMTISAVPIAVPASQQVMVSTVAPATTLVHQHYRLLETIGSGGFAKVYRAVDTSYNHIVALKQIQTHILSSRDADEATACFYREVWLLSTLRHRNLPQMYDYFSEDGSLYMVMEYIKGKTLEDYLQCLSEGRLPLKETVEIGITLCDVLEYLHTRTPAIIYRDLKPENIMRRSDGRIFLIDFGIARHYKAGQARDTRKLGSPGYAAPEQYGLAQTSARSDIYSLGMLLRKLLTGQEPGEEVDSGNASSVKIPSRMQRTLARMMATDASKRPASAQKVKMRLLRIRGDIRKRRLKKMGLYLIGLLIGFGTGSLLAFGTTYLSSSLGYYAQMLYCTLPLGYLIAMSILFTTRWRMIAAGMLTLPLLGVVWLILTYIAAIR